MIRIWTKWKEKWDVETDRRMAWIFLIFAITGSTTVWVRKYIFELLGISAEAFAYRGVYILVKLLSIYIVYQILLFTIGSLFGEYRFVKWFIIKMNSRMVGFRTKKK